MILSYTKLNSDFQCVLMMYLKRNAMLRKRIKKQERKKRFAIGLDIVYIFCKH